MESTNLISLDVYSALEALGCRQIVAVRLIKDVRWDRWDLIWPEGTLLLVGLDFPLGPGVLVDTPEGTKAQGITKGEYTPLGIKEIEARKADLKRALLSCEYATLILAQANYEGLEARKS